MVSPEAALPSPPEGSGPNCGGFTDAGLILAVPSSWRAWLHLASLLEERGDLPGYPLEFLVLAVVGDEVLE
jgi:hypothetical protein